MSKFITLILIPSLLHNASCTVYIVTPDNDNHHYPNTTCHHCHNLQYYLLNVTKYFTSNSQLLFLSGVHRLHTDLIIQNVYNISLIGSTANDTTPVSVIQYTEYDNIAILHSTMVTIKNLIFIHYGDYSLGETFKIFECHYIQMHNMVMDMKIIGHNMMGLSNLSDITCSNDLHVTYDNSVIIVEPVTHKLVIYNYTIKKGYYSGIDIRITQPEYGVSIIITDSIFSHLCNKLTVLINSSCTDSCTIIFNGVHFISNNNACLTMGCLLYIQFDLHSCSASQSVIKRDEVIIDDCLFIDNTNVNKIVHGVWFDEVVNNEQDITIHNCSFINNTVGTNILLFTSHGTYMSLTTGHIVNTDFISNAHNNNKHHVTALVNSDISLALSGPIIIHGNTFTSIFTMNDNLKSVMILKGYFEFSQNIATYMIQVNTLGLVKHVMMNLTKNVITYLFVSYKLQYINDHISICYFQFYEMEAKRTK